jgi:pyrroloquinoline quinone biosynthesis protein B
VRIRVLGSAAGGGFPQWNCGCPNCRGVRAGTVRAAARTQESVAVSADGAGWLLLNASPEIRQQIESFDGLHPRAPRHSPIHAIVLTNGDLDHVLGLLSLRESHPLVVYATDSVRAGFTEGNVLYRTLQRFPEQVTWRPLKPGREEALAGADGRASGLLVEPVAVPGKPPIHLEGRLEGPLETRHTGAAAPDPEDNIGLRIREASTGRRLAYFPAAGGITPAVAEALEDADCVFFDGTFWSSDELPAQGLGTKRAADMAHLPIGGSGGSLGALHGLKAARRVYIHVNNTNPILREDSPERKDVEAAGWQIAWDGMELSL